jgi:UDPglucose--hexose-1-phosphate uridylyltransferase
MNILTPRPTDVNAAFFHRYANDKKAATDFFYDLCRSCNYIQTERLSRNIGWLVRTEYGELEITINLSKPEKDPVEIAAARSAAASSYPKCLLCLENVGNAGSADRPGRQNLRVIPLSLGGENWYFQYSPYVYYNEHCIVFNERHTPMQINDGTFLKLIEFLRGFPHYFIGSNADLPVVGGSILAHDHFQGGRHIFPLDRAAAYKKYAHTLYPSVAVSLVKWPMSVIRLTANEENADAQIASLASLFLKAWRSYSDPEHGVIAFTGDTPHNTITPIARFNRDGFLELDLVLRNNRATAEHPLGVFHPHAERHHIKKENIGLIEVMGLAILPGRLKGALEKTAAFLRGDAAYDGGADLRAHAAWIEGLLARCGRGNSPARAAEIVRDGVGRVFLDVLSDCGVFKDTERGCAGFMRFLDSCMKTG